MTRPMTQAGLRASDSDRVPRLRVAGAHVKEKLRNMQIGQWTWP